MVKRFFTAGGRVIDLGRELGKGGEGSVFEVPALPNQVAKLYHKPVDARKQTKLRFMSAHSDATLLKYTACPQDTLHPAQNGPVAGFLMPKIVGRDPIHQLYSPAQRRQERPKAAWDFLLFVARNTAAAFETLHAHGHVLADVNQGNVMVGADSQVVLIDCDSLQVNAAGTLHLCEVGVSHFTPPELQGLSSFRGVTRTANHDNFGLALLIFHLLFGGRHPYAGIPLTNSAGESLESDIKAFRYAYASDARRRGFDTPPRSIPLGLVPPPVQALFEQAFTEQGAQMRPSAKTWVSVLDGLRQRLRKCTTSAMHVYPDHLLQCPWCGLEQQGAVFFVDLGAAITFTSSGFVFARVFALIEAVPVPAAISPPVVPSASIQAAPLSADISGSKRQVALVRSFFVVLTLVLCATMPKLFFFWVVGAVIGWAVAENSISGARRAELGRRRSAKQAAQRTFDALMERARKECGPESFLARKKQLLNLRDEYQDLGRREQAEMEQLTHTAEARQKEKFLERFFIDRATIHGVGPAKKAALRSFGIETAADVEWNKVRNVKGFGDVLTRAVVDWRVAQERRFVFNPAQAVTDADRNAVRAKFLAKKQTVEAGMTSGPAELHRLANELQARKASYNYQLAEAAKTVAQAKADLALIE
jgi:DNA-binding helix-hairpin-helix protein with protein kinase domain